MEKIKQTDTEKNFSKIQDHNLTNIVVGDKIGEGNFGKILGKILRKFFILLCFPKSF